MRFKHNNIYMVFLRKFKIQILCISLGFTLFFLAQNFMQDEDDIFQDGYVKREGYGEYNRNHEIYVEGLSDEKLLIKVPVSHRRYADDELEEVFDKCMSILSERILGDNKSLQEVRSNLNLISEVKEYGIAVRWISDDNKLIDAFGTVYNEDLSEAKDTVLKVFLSDRQREANFELKIRVLPKVYSKDEKKLKDFMDLLAKTDKEYISNENYKLPTSFEGKKISYSLEPNYDMHIIWVLGIVIAAILYVKDIVKLKEEKDHRLKQMMLDYPEIISKLMVFIGAGLSIRSAWEQVVTEYERSGIGERYAYEEMIKAQAKLKTGVHEAKVYKDFGRSCASKQYMKLASLLEQNRKTGLSNLKQMLSMEMAAAWDERVNMARRQGEEASTKLLLPLLMMLAVVLIIIMLPALMAFQ